LTGILAIPTVINVHRQRDVMNPRRKRTRLWLACPVFVMVSSCAFDVIRVKQEPARFVPNASERPDERPLREDVEVTLDTGYKRTLKAGTRWQCIGNIENGDVYQTSDQILTVEGSNIHEACIVVSDRKKRCWKSRIAITRVNNPRA